jgi:V-type H+-transporting ATPase proteolipid subunit
MLTRAPAVRALTDPFPARSYAHLAGGLAVGLSNLASGLSIGMCADIGVRDSARQPKLYIGMVLIWSFASALGLYGLIVGLIVATKGDNQICEASL